MATRAASEIVTDFASRYTVRISVISLRRNKARWAGAEATLSAIQKYGADIDCRVHEGVDGHAYKNLLLNDNDDCDYDPREQEGVIEAVEKAVGARVFRGWPICEEEDVVRAAGEERDKIKGNAWIYVRNCTPVCYTEPPQIYHRPTTQTVRDGVV